MRKKTILCRKQDTTTINAIYKSLKIHCLAVISWFQHRGKLDTQELRNESEAGRSIGPIVDRWGPRGHFTAEVPVAGPHLGSVHPNSTHLTESLVQPMHNLHANINLLVQNNSRYFMISLRSIAFKNNNKRQCQLWGLSVFTCTLPAAGQDVLQEGSIVASTRFLTMKMSAMLSILTRRQLSPHSRTRNSSQFNVWRNGDLRPTSQLPNGFLPPLFDAGREWIKFSFLGKLQRSRLVYLQQNRTLTVACKIDCLTFLIFIMS